MTLVLQVLLFLDDYSEISVSDSESSNDSNVNGNNTSNAGISEEGSYDSEAGLTSSAPGASVPVGLHLSTPSIVIFWACVMLGVALPVVLLGSFLAWFSGLLGVRCCQCDVLGCRSGCRPNGKSGRMANCRSKSDALELLRQWRVESRPSGSSSQAALVIHGNRGSLPRDSSSSYTSGLAGPAPGLLNVTRIPVEVSGERRFGEAQVMLENPLMGGHNSNGPMRQADSQVLRVRNNPMYRRRIDTASNSGLPAQEVPETNNVRHVDSTVARSIEGTKESDQSRHSTETSDPHTGVAMTGEVVSEAVSATGSTYVPEDLWHRDQFKQARDVWSRTRCKCFRVLTYRLIMPKKAHVAVICTPEVEQHQPAQSLRLTLILGLALPTPLQSAY